MIGFVKGKIADIQEDCLLVENQGIGWQIFVPASLLSSNVQIGESVTLYTYLHVREDAMQLFGFFSKDELDVFGKLLNISGIGPKNAMGILSALSADDLRFAVLSQDADRIAEAPGIGKKTAQKLILELQDKFQLEEAFAQKMQHQTVGSEDKQQEEEGAEADAVQALVALGYSGTEALQAIRKVQDASGMNSEDLLKAALRYIF